MNNIKKNTISLPYSLHDSRIQTIKYENNSLILSLNQIFSYSEEGEKMYQADVIFEKSDLESSYVLLFNQSLCDGESLFLVKKLPLLKFMKQYQKNTFEILTETYNDYDIVLLGELWNEDEPNYSAILMIYKTGDMIYRIQDEIK